MFWNQRKPSYRVLWNFSTSTLNQNLHNFKVLVLWDYLNCRVWEVSSNTRHRTSLGFQSPRALKDSGAARLSKALGLWNPSKVLCLVYKFFSVKNSFICLSWQKCCYILSAVHTFFEKIIIIFWLRVRTVRENIKPLENFPLKTIYRYIRNNKINCNFITFSLLFCFKMCLFLPESSWPLKVLVKAEYLHSGK